MNEDKGDIHIEKVLSSEPISQEEAHKFMCRFIEEERGDDLDDDQEFMVEEEIMAHVKSICHSMGDHHDEGRGAGGNNLTTLISQHQKENAAETTKSATPTESKKDKKALKKEAKAARKAERAAKKAAKKERKEKKRKRKESTPEKKKKSKKKKTES